MIPSIMELQSRAWLISIIQRHEIHDTPFARFLLETCVDNSWTTSTHESSSDWIIEEAECCLLIKLDKQL